MVSRDQSLKMLTDFCGELEFFYQQLLADQPGLVGGKLPPAAFYG